VSSCHAGNDDGNDAGEVKIKQDPFYQGASFACKKESKKKREGDGQESEERRPTGTEPEHQEESKDGSPEEDYMKLARTGLHGRQGKKKKNRSGNGQDPEIYQENVLQGSERLSGVSGQEGGKDISRKTRRSMSQEIKDPQVEEPGGEETEQGDQPFSRIKRTK